MNNIADIYLDSVNQEDFKNYYLFGEEKPIEILPNFAKINILVGSNNSGKSRFMRTLMKQQQIKSISSFKKFIEKLNAYNKLVEKLNINWTKNHSIISSSPIQLISQNNSFLLTPIVFNTADYFQPIDNQHFENHTKLIQVIQEIGEVKIRDYYFNATTSTKIDLGEGFTSRLAEAVELNKELQSIYKINTLGSNLNYFIPTLRTAHSLFEEKTNQEFFYSKLKKDIFYDTLLKNYKLKNFITKEAFLKEEDEKSKVKKTYIFTGLNLYNQIVNARNGTKVERERFDDFEKFIGKEFFDKESIDIVAQFNINEKHQDKDENEIINIHIGDNSRNLHDLGDGVQSLIILMYSIFMAPENTIIFIDEPELNLHPGMQRLFLEQITNNKALTKKNLTYVIATHSNHLLDLTIEKNNISIYSFSKNEDNKLIVKNVNVGDNELLRELGVNNSSVFLANSSIWVEGISDRNYIKAFLIAYCSAHDSIRLPKEDIDFAFLEYAGSNLTHYDFTEIQKDNIKAFALNNRIFILSDNDAEKEEKHKSYKELCMQNPKNLTYETTSPFREIENLLSDEVWKKTLIDLCNKSKVKADTSKIQASIVKKIEAIKIETYKEKYIGEYLKALNLEELNDVYEILKTSPKSLKSDYKTHLSKVILDKTLSNEITWDDFSKNNTVLELTKQVYDFITKRN